MGRADAYDVVDGLVAPKGYVEMSGLVEATEPVEAGAVQVVEERRCLRRVVLALGNERIETGAGAIVMGAIVPQRDVDDESSLEMRVEVDDVRVDVVEDGTLGAEAQGDRQTADEGLDKTPRSMRLPEWAQVWQLPSLATRPLERRTELN